MSPPARQAPDGADLSADLLAKGASAVMRGDGTPMQRDLHAALVQLRRGGDLEVSLPRDVSKATIFNISTPPPELDDGGASASTAVDDADDVPVFDLSADGPEDFSGTHASLDEDVPVFDISASPGDRERRLLCDVMWASRQSWTPRDLVAADKKLAKVGVTSLRDLLSAIVAGDLNQRLRAAGQQPFGEGTLRELRRQAQKAVEEGERFVLPRAAWRPGSGPGQLQAARERLLCDVLWESRPAWTPSDLAAAERKLALVGIEDVGALDVALARGLNKGLREAGLKTFSPETVEALRRRLDEVHGRIDWWDKQAVWMNSGEASEASLRDVLWECRPTWSNSELAAAEHKLSLVGVTSVPELAQALASGLNQKLKAAGLKAFSSDTLSELRRRLGLAQPRAASDGADLPGTSASAEAAPS